MKHNLTISSSPHILGKLTVPGIMWGVSIALLPAVIASLILFKLLALKVIITCIVSSCLVEALAQKIRKRPITIKDGSAVLTGLLLTMVLPPASPVWMCMLGSLVAIGLGKQLFGGLGFNIFNPALLSRAFLMAAFPTILTKWIAPFTLDAVTQATPLGLAKFEHIATPYMDLFLGNVTGSLGETSAIALLIGGGYLLIKKYADWRIPLSFLITSAIFASILHMLNPALYPDALMHILSGGMLIGALFMATDPVTSPVTKKGRWVFGIGCGILVIVMRIWSGLPEGVMYAILLMNGITPLINKYSRQKRFGFSRRGRVR